MDNSNNYYIKKATYAKELYDKGLPFVKVYAPVRDGDKFIVLEKTSEKGTTYHLAGGGVDEGESLEEAIRRELLEELNLEVEIIKKLGTHDTFYKTWELNGKKFDVRYEIHVFDTKLKKQLNGDFGLEGEFNNIKIVKIDKKTLLNNVAEFCKFNIELK